MHSANAKSNSIVLHNRLACFADTPTEDMLRRCCDPAGIAVLRGELLKRVSALAVQELSIPSVTVQVDKTSSWAVDTE